MAEPWYAPGPIQFADEGMLGGLKSAGREIKKAFVEVGGDVKEAIGKRLPERPQRQRKQRPQQQQQKPQQQPQQKAPQKPQYHPDTLKRWQAIQAGQPMKGNSIAEQAIEMGRVHGLVQSLEDVHHVSQAVDKEGAAKALNELQARKQAAPTDSYLGHRSGTRETKEGDMITFEGRHYKYHGERWHRMDQQQPEQKGGAGTYNVTHPQHGKMQIETDDKGNIVKGPKSLKDAGITKVHPSKFGGKAEKVPGKKVKKKPFADAPRYETQKRLPESEAKPDAEGWREVGKGEAIPPGQDIKMDMRTGKNYVRPLPEKKKGPAFGKGLTRNWRAGMNQGSVTFDSEKQRDAFDWASRNRFGGQSNYKEMHNPRKKPASLESIKQKYGMEPKEWASYAVKEYDHVKQHMKGVGATEGDDERTVPPLPIGENHPARAAFDKHLQSHANLDPKARDHYAKSAKKVFDTMPDKALERFHKGSHGGYQFFNDSQELTEATAKFSTKAKELADAGGSVGGLYRRSQGKILVNGGGETEWDKTHNIYAHEFTHAIDGANHEISDSPEWKHAWEQELSGGQVNDYATTSTSEGFAEFGRLAYGMGVDPNILIAQYPKCAAVWSQHGLFPQGSARPDEAMQEMPDIFDKEKVIDEEGQHADVILEQQQEEGPDIFDQQIEANEGVEDEETKQLRQAREERIKKLPRKNTNLYKAMKDISGDDPEEMADFHEVVQDTHSDAIKEVENFNSAFSELISMDIRNQDWKSHPLKKHLDDFKDIDKAQMDPIVKRYEDNSEIQGFLGRAYGKFEADSPEAQVAEILRHGPILKKDYPKITDENILKDAKGRMYGTKTLAEMGSFRGVQLAEGRSWIEVYRIVRDHIALH